MVRTAPVTLEATTTRHRRDRSRPLGRSRAGSVIPSVIAGAQLRSPDATTTWATKGKGRCSRTSFSTQGPTGMAYAQARPAAPYSQPIGLPGRRSDSTSPTVANPSTKKNAYTAPSPSTVRVRGRVMARVTSSPAAQQPKVTSHSAQASTSLVRGPNATLLHPP